jgi:hypothetical protein
MSDSAKTYSPRPSLRTPYEPADLLIVDQTGIALGPYTRRHVFAALRSLLLYPISAHLSTADVTFLCVVDPRALTFRPLHYIRLASTVWWLAIWFRGEIQG